VREDTTGVATLDEFVTAALSFPAVLFTAALAVVAVFWLLVLIGTAEPGTFDGDMDTGAAGLAGVPVTVSLSLLTALAWFLTLTGSIAAGRTGAAGGLLLGLEVLALAAGSALAWWLTRLLVRPLAALFPDEPRPSRRDFVGMACVIRTHRVDEGFGQAEVTARDGSTALVQVRQSDAYPLERGTTGLLYAYDEAGEFFWVAPR
jgi:hypothetical protein